MSRAMQVICAGRNEADLAKRGAISSLVEDLRPTIIINAAAFTAVDEAERNREEAYAVNAAGAQEAARAAHRFGARYILISTDYVFGGDKADGPFDETAHPKPVNAYGEIKLKAEALTLSACPNAIVVRTSAVFSGGGADFPSTMWRLASSSDTISVVDDQLTCPTHAGGLARRLIALARSPGACGTYHAVGVPDASWADFAKTAMAVSRNAGGPYARIEPIATSQLQRTARRPADSRLASRRLEAEIGLAPDDWRDSLSKAFEIWRSKAQN